MSLDPRNHTYKPEPHTPQPDEFSFARQDSYNTPIVISDHSAEEDADSIYTLDEPGQVADTDTTEGNTLYDLPTHISSHGELNNVTSSPRTMPPSPVGTPYTERPTHPLRALTSTNLVLNQQNGTDESLIASSPVVTSTLRQKLSLEDLAGSDQDDDIPITPAMHAKADEWDEKGAAIAVTRVTNANGEDEDVIIRKSVKDFKFGKTLGIGSYSTVILATDKNTNRQFAVKVLDKRHIIREKKVKYVNIEKNTLSRLGRRDGIVHMFFTFQDESSLYFVLDYAPNGELLTLIKEHGSLNEETAKYYSAQILDAIKYMHDNGVIHRDLKPENILLDENMKIQITDFGTAKLLEKSPNGQYPADTRSKSFVGTAEYVSPELLNEKAVGKPCDIWAFGCILYQMIAGKPPFKATNEYLTFQKIVKLQFAFTAGFPMVIRDLIKKILVLHPKDRLTVKGIQNHLFFHGIDFKNPQKSIWDVPPPVAGPYKISAKSMLPVPELQNNGSRTRITIPRRAVSTPSTPMQEHETGSTESFNSTPPASTTPTVTTESQQVLARAKANIAARKQKESQRASSGAVGAAGAAALALSRQPNDIIKAYNDAKKESKSDLDNGTPPVSASSNMEKRVPTSASTTAAPPTTQPTAQPTAQPSTKPAPTITTLRKKPPQLSTEKASVPPMTKLDLEFVKYLKNKDERVLKKGDLNVYLTTVDAIEKKYKRRLVDAPLGGNKAGFSSSTMLSQVANGSYRGLRNMDKHGEEAEKAIITNHKTEEDESKTGSAKTKFKKFFSGSATEEDKKNRVLLVTSNGRAMIFNKLDAEENQTPALELRTEISVNHPVIKIRELLPTSTSEDSQSLFIIESYNTAFVFESTQKNVSSWTNTLHKARVAVQEKIMQKRLEEDPSGNAGTVLGSDAAMSAATIVTSPTLGASEFKTQTKPRRSSSSSTPHQRTHMLQEVVQRKSAARPTPANEVPEQGRLYHGLPISLLTPKDKNQNRNPLIAAAEAAIGTGSSPKNPPARKKPPSPAMSASSNSNTNTTNTTTKHITGMNSRLLARSVRSSKSKK